MHFFVSRLNKCNHLLHRVVTSAAIHPKRKILTMPAAIQAYTKMPSRKPSSTAVLGHSISVVIAVIGIIEVCV